MANATENTPQNAGSAPVPQTTQQQTVQTVEQSKMKDTGTGGDGLIVMGILLAIAVGAFLTWKFWSKKQPPTPKAEAAHTEKIGPYDRDTLELAKAVTKVFEKI